MNDQDRPLFLFAEDDDDDWMLIEDTFNECHPSDRLARVKNGLELMDWLRDPSQEQPSLILLDLKMPKMGGHEVLQKIRADEKLRHLPVIIMTTSRSESDIWESYYHGANSYLAKPLAEPELQSLHHYWSNLVELPRAHVVGPS